MQAREEALLTVRLLRFTNQMRFLELVASGKFLLAGKSKAQLEAELLALHFLEGAALCLMPYALCALCLMPYATA
jgi:hypothetical protein